MTEAGSKVQIVYFGSPEQLSAIVPVNPPEGAKVIVVCTALPSFTVALVGVRLMLKSGAGGALTTILTVLDVDAAKFVSPP